MIEGLKSGQVATIYSSNPISKTSIGGPLGGTGSLVFGKTI